MDRLLYEDSVKGIQLRMSVSEFREVYYLHIRKYFLDFEGEFRPSNEGVAMPLNMSSTLALFLAASEILSDSEIELVPETLQEILETWKTLNASDSNSSDT